MKLRKAILQVINNVNTKNKLFITYVFVVFIPVLIVGIFLTISMRNMALDRAIEESKFNVDRVKKRVTEALEVPANITNKLFIDKKLEALVTTQYKTPFEMVQASWNYRELGDLADLYKNEIKNIRIFVENDTLMNTPYIYRASEEIKAKAWYQTALNNNNKSSWELIYSEFNIFYPDYYLVLTREMFTYDKPNGILVISVDRNNLAEILNQESFETILIDDKDQVISAKDTKVIGKKKNELEIRFDQANSYEKIFDGEYKGKPAKFIVDTLSVEGVKGTFSVISVFSVNSILAEANRISLMGFAIIAVSLIISIILILIFSSILSRRIQKISTEMHRVAQGDFSSISSIEGNDEIGQLARDMNLMTQSLNSLVHEVYEANLQKKQLSIKQKEIKFKMLANQINPHFLFNTLETIRMKAHCKGQDDIADVIQKLGALLRRNLEAGKEEVTLDKEIELVRDYLEIQKFRFGEKIEYEIYTNENTNSYFILPLLLQPIVENAVVHGVENAEENVKIKIDFIREAEVFRIIVSDNGAGMTKERREWVIASLEDSESETSKRVGIKNVHQRIKLYYGEQYGIQINSEQGIGTKVELILPWKRNEEN